MDRLPIELILKILEYLPYNFLKNCPVFTKILTDFPYILKEKAYPDDTVDFDELFKDYLICNCIDPISESHFLRRAYRDEFIKCTEYDRETLIAAYESNKYMITTVVNHKIIAIKDWRIKGYFISKNSFNYCDILRKVVIKPVPANTNVSILYWRTEFPVKVTRNGDTVTLDNIWLPMHTIFNDVQIHIDAIDEKEELDFTTFGNVVLNRRDRILLDTFNNGMIVRDNKRILMSCSNGIKILSL